VGLNFCAYIIGPVAYQGMIRAMVCILAAWLHVNEGLSRETTSTILKFFNYVLQLAVEYGCMKPFGDLQTASDEMANGLEGSAYINIPHDTCTAVHDLAIEPNISRSVCCPNCYTQYPFEDIPIVCTYSPASWSLPCGERDHLAKMGL
jgi:hypothetical protein